jgi:streptogramin lyase
MNLSSLQSGRWAEVATNLRGRRFPWLVAATVRLVIVGSTVFGCAAADVGSPADPESTAPATASLIAATATASSIQGAGLPASNAVDNNLTTRWSSQFTDNQWIYVDLGSVQPFDDVKLYWENAYAQSYQLQVSNDAAHWTTLKSFTKTSAIQGAACSNTGTSWCDEFTGLAATGRYVRMLGIKRATQYGYSLWEFQVNTCTTGTTQCSGDSIQTCTAAGTWSAPAHCGGASACTGNACAVELTIASGAFTATQNVQVTGPIFYVTDTLYANGAGTFSIAWGDGATSTGQVTQGSSSGFGSHVYSTATTPLTATFTVSDPSTGATASASYPVTIRPASQATITEFPTSSQPNGITASDDGNVYAAESGGYIAQIYQCQTNCAPDQTVGTWYLYEGIQYPAPNQFFGIAAAPDYGGLPGWVAVTETSANQLVFFNPDYYPDAYFPFNTPTTGSFPFGVTAGPGDSNVWFTEQATSKIGVYLGDSGSINEYTIPTPGSFPEGIKVGPDNALWFAEEVGNIGRLTTAGAFSEYPLSASSGPTDVVAGPDGAMWFADWNANKIGRITLDGRTVTEFSLQKGFSPNNIILGPDGNLWFTEGGGYIGRITPTWALTEFPIPTSGNGAFGITSASGLVWFTETGWKVGSITP